MQGRCRQHEGKRCQVRSQLFRQRLGQRTGQRIRQRLQDDGRTHGRGKKLCLVFRKPAKGAYGFKGAAHKRKGLVGPVFALPQKLYHVCPAGIADKLKAAKPAQGKNFSCNDGVCGPVYGRCHGRGGRLRFACQHILMCQKPEPWPALRAGNRLCMKAPVERIRVFPAAVRTHGKAGHGGHFPVVWD